MAEDTGGQEKTEEATPKKREKAREEGQVAKSAEVASVIVLMTGIVTLFFFAGFVYDEVAALMIGSFRFDSIPVFNQPHFVDMSIFWTGRFFLILSPLLVAVFMAAVFANVIQVGFSPSSKAIEPKFNKIDPIKGFGRIFSSRSMAELVKSVLKILIISLITYLVVRGDIETVLRLHDNTVGEILVYTLKMVFKIFFWILIAMIALAILDFAYQKWQHENQIKMTKQEVKEEYKQTEGDPHVKSRIRSIQMEAARKRMMQEVPKADVVVTNPTHLSVAIRYDGMTMIAPKIVAKGAGPVALRIREIAREADVPVVENRELARNLYKTVDIGDEIPSEMFQAVAELLAYVYQLKKRTL